MKRLFGKLFPNYITRADLTIVEGDLGQDILLLKGRIALLESCIALSADAIEIAAARLYAAERRIEELEAATFISVGAVSAQIETFEAVPVSCDGRATRTEIVEIKPKGRGPKNGGGK